MLPLPPRYYNRLQREAGPLLIPPLQERPGFSLVHPGAPAAGLREIRPNGVLRSSPAGAAPSLRRAASAWRGPATVAPPRPGSSPSAYSAPAQAATPSTPLSP